MNTMLVIARFTALETARSRLAWLVAGATIAGCAFALFAGELAIIEARGFRAGLLGAWLRSCAVLTAAAYVVASMVREFDDNGMELMLSAPAPRGTYYAGKLTGFAGVAVLWTLVGGCALVWHAPPAQVGIWAASLGLEVLLVVAMSLACVLSLSRVTSALGAVMGFYVLSRAIAALQLMAHEPLAVHATVSQRFVRGFVDALAFVLPDLDRFTESSWLIHGDGTMADLGFAAAQTAIYLGVLAAVALFDLYRKAL